MSLAVLIPSRNRYPQLQEAVRSVKNTAPGVPIFVYCDRDANQYPEPETQVSYVIGDRVGAAKSLNLMVDRVRESNPEIDGFAMMTDDSVMTVAGWNGWLEHQFNSFPGRIGVVSPSCNDIGAHRVDMPSVTTAWIDAVGFYSHPGMNHYGWPSVIDILSDGICLIKAEQSEYEIRHRNIASKYSSFDQDAVEFYQWVAWHKDEARATLRNEISKASL